MAQPATKVLGAYLEAWNYSQPIDAMPSSYNVIYHAFVRPAYDGSVSIYTGGQSPAAVQAKYAERKAAGKRTILSIGGALSPNQVNVASGLGSTADQDRFLATIIPIIDAYHFNGIDWDLEQGMRGGISVQGVVRISRELRARYGSDFWVTMAPFGMAEVRTPYLEIAKQLHATGDLTYVGFQFYNDLTPTAQRVIDEMKLWMNYAKIGPQQFVIGFWHGPWDWPAGFWFPYSSMVSVYNAVEAQYPDIRGTYTWGLFQVERNTNHAFATNLAPAVF